MKIMNCAMISRGMFSNRRVPEKTSLTVFIHIKKALQGNGSTGMDSELFTNLVSENCILNLKEIKQCHRFVCHVMNCILKSKKLKYIVLDDEMKIKFCKYVKKLKYLVKETNNLKELCRFWKVKRVQIAKVLIDVFDGKLEKSRIIEKIQNVIENAFIYTTKNIYIENYYFILFIKVLYKISFYLNEKIFYY